MEYGRIQFVNKAVSRLIFGCANPLMMQGKKIFELLDEALALGINTFDTAQSYGASEDVLGKWIKKRKNREKVVVISKGCHPCGGPRVNPEDLEKDLKNSLKKLRTDYIDIYMLHRDHPDADIKAIMQVLNEYQKAGKIGGFGVSNWKHERIAEANGYALKNHLNPFIVSSPNFGPASQVGDPWGEGCVSISGSENAAARSWYRDNHVPVLAYSSLGRGMFSGKVETANLEQGKAALDKFALRGYWAQENIDRLGRMEIMAKEKACSISQLSLAWTIQQDFEVFPIVTTSDGKRIKENIGSLEVKLSEEERKIITGF
ncbi:MAG: aldo/keto reductase [Lachnospiraceae bacterium]|nr:aldo/keto reductase [Lachnospiraceae bacterium]MDD7027475.1 aldo/keto reductase [Lachnospiraceae bacterium]MDY5701536.1 aldo/keto reductase [Lachnospiraceae bacterium]